MQVFICKYETNKRLFIFIQVRCKHAADKHGDHSAFISKFESFGVRIRRCLH